MFLGNYYTSPDLKTMSEPESLLDSAGVEPGGGGSRPELSQDSTAESTEGMAGPKRPSQSLRPNSSLVTPGQHRMSRKQIKVMSNTICETTACIRRECHYTRQHTVFLAIKDNFSTDTTHCMTHIMSKYHDIFSCDSIFKEATIHSLLLFIIPKI